MEAVKLLLIGLDMSAFSERLRTFREARALTQTRLAEMIGVLPRVYNRWERGHILPQLEKMIKLADVLQVSIDELLGRTELKREDGVKIRNYELHELWQQADMLPDEEQKALILVIGSFVTKVNVEKAVLQGMKSRK